jgi:hypothetical protein
MNGPRRGRKSILLGGLCFLGLAYILMLMFRPTLTGQYQWDGILSVLLGLYICSHPVANILDVILFGRLLGQRVVIFWVEGAWWSLNALVLFIGWLVIYVGMLRFTAAA